MRNTLLAPITPFFALLGSCIAYSHDVVSSEVVTSSWTTSYGGTSWSLSLHDGTVGADSFVMGSEAFIAWQYGLGTDQFCTALHQFGAYVRVKWVAKANPDPTINYTGKYRVWGLRYLHSITHFFQGIPNRWATNSGSVLGNYVPLPSQATFYTAFPDTGEAEFGSDFDIFDNEYPVYGGNQYGWEYMGEEASSAQFVKEGDDWYANFPITNAFIHDGHFETGGPLQSVDSIFTTHQARVYYQLWWAVDGPVS